MNFEELKIMTNNKFFVIDTIEKRLTERNVSYVKLNYDGYTEFHFLNYIYRLVFLDLEKEMVGKYEALNMMMNSIDKGFIENMDNMFFDVNEKNTNICMPETYENNRSGYKKYRKEQDKKFNNKKIDVKSKIKTKFYRR